MAIADFQAYLRLIPAVDRAPQHRAWLTYDAEVDTLYVNLDQDVRVALADILRQRGYDAIHVLEIGRAGRSDLEQFLLGAKQATSLCLALWPAWGSKAIR